MFRLILTLLLLAGLSRAELSKTERDWNAPQAPFRIAGNLYYVGTADLASFLITTPQGHILINTDLTESAPQILEHLKSLGFQPKDVRYILNSQAHYDHAAGTKLIQQATGAKVVMSEADAPFIEKGKSLGLPQTWAPVKVDRRIKDGDTVALGGTTLTAHVTPGHTPGCTTWTFTVHDGGRDLRAVILGGYTVVTKLNGNREYPTIVSDYRKTFALLKQIPCDLFLAAHASQFHMHEKLKSSSPDRFIDPQGYRTTIEQAEAEFERKLAAGE